MTLPARICSLCKREQPADQFMRRSKAKNQPDSHCRACKRAYRRAWGSRNKAKIHETDAASRMAIRLAVLAAYGSVCACCGESAVEFLAISRIDGGSRKHRESLGPDGHGSQFFRWLQDEGFPPGFRVLCHNCNMAFGFYGRCPHQQAKPALACDDPKQPLL